jgi:hypothetical protein
MEKKERQKFWTAEQKMKWEQAGNPLKTHDNCLRILGVARPGKTAQDKASVV